MNQDFEVTEKTAEEYAKELAVATPELAKRLSEVRQMRKQFEHTTKYAWYAKNNELLPQPLQKFQVRTKENEVGKIEFAYNAPSADEIRDLYLPNSIKVGEETIAFGNVFQRLTKTYCLGYLHDEHPQLSIIQQERHTIEDYAEIAIRLSDFLH